MIAPMSQAWAGSSASSKISVYHPGDQLARRSYPSMISPSSPVRRSSRRAASTAVVKQEEQEPASSNVAIQSIQKPAGTKRKRPNSQAKVDPAAVEVENESKIESDAAGAKSGSKTENEVEPRRRAKKEDSTEGKMVIINSDPEPTAGAEASISSDFKPKPKRSKKPPPLTASQIIPVLGADSRNTISSHWIGAHVSAAGGPHNALLNALAIGANAVALFVRPKMQWASKPMDLESVEEFRRITSKEAGFGFGEELVKEQEVGGKGKSKEKMKAKARIMPHGCYLINLANPNDAKREKAMEAFLDDVRRCHQLGITLYNFHPGSTCGDCTQEQGFASIAACIDEAHRQVPDVVILLENMAGTGNIVGGKFEDLRRIMDLVQDKSRVGVCIDTAHAFAAGYDLRSASDYESTMSSLSNIIGLQNVRGMHLNDSKAELGSKRDRHENIGQGKMGLMPFWRIMNDPRWEHVPCVLETHAGEDQETMNAVLSREIDLLYKLEGLKDGDWSDVHRLMREVQEVKRLGEEKAKAKTKRTSVKKAAGPVAKKPSKKAKPEPLPDNDES